MTPAKPAVDLVMNSVEAKSSPDLLYSFRPRSGEITSLNYVKVREDEAGIVSG